MSKKSVMPTWTWHSVWPAPAKLNLFLHVVGRRADGYHLLQTVFRFLDFGDSLRFRPLANGEICLRYPTPGVAPEEDITVRAARLLQSTTGCTQGVEIDLEKRVPMGGGLGGGSSDAATVLIALNHLWQLGLSREQLQALGLQLGADVPIFIFGDNAFAEGVGERLQAITLPASYYVVLQPPVHVPTPLIFRDPELCRNTPVLDPQHWQVGEGKNDLQPVATRLFPVIAEYLDYLQPFGAAMMTGSGACVFVPVADLNTAHGILRHQIPVEVNAWVAKGLAHHPLRDV